LATDAAKADQEMAALQTEGDKIILQTTVGAVAGSMGTFGDAAYVNSKGTIELNAAAVDTVAAGASAAGEEIMEQLEQDGNRTYAVNAPIPYMLATEQLLRTTGEAAKGSSSSTAPAEQQIAEGAGLAAAYYFGEDPYRATAYALGVFIGLQIYSPLANFAADVLESATARLEERIGEERCLLEGLC
jgi:sugar (pentulose or hexulose) kinase